MQTLHSNKIDFSFVKNASVAPIVSLYDYESRIHDVKKVSYLVVPFYEFWDHNSLWETLGHKDIHDFLRFNGPVGLSSIGPDDYVLSEAYFTDFVRLSTENNFDFVVAWDMPTYADWPAELSWKNTIRGLELVKRLAAQGIEVIGLLNGNSRAQFEACADSLLSMGIDRIAVHVSDYLRFRKDPLLAMLLQDSVRTACSKSNKVLIVGATDPYFLKYEGKGLFPEASVCGFSWFIDAQHGLAYGIRGRVNTFESDAICHCSYCITNEPSVLSRSTLSRAIHNFSAVENSIRGEDLPSLETFDIIHGGQKLVFVSGLYLGTKESLLVRFEEAMRKEKPETLVLVGDTFDIANPDSQLLRDHSRSFFGLLFQIDCEVYPMFGGRDSSLEALSQYVRKATYGRGIHPNIKFWKYMGQDVDETFYMLHKFYTIAKREISIRLNDGRVVHVAHGPLLSPKFPSSAGMLETVTDDMIGIMLRVNGCDSLILGGYDTKIIKEDKLYSLGGWRSRTTDQERIGLTPDLMGALIVDNKGIRYKEFQT